jgi:hypothetical protein
MAENNITAVGQAARDLFDFAVDREDVKWLLMRLPAEAQVKRATVEYELQILKIVSVGWSIAYYLECSPLKNLISERYWKAVNAFAGSLSETAGLMVGRDIDYFQTLKDRLDMYVAALSAHPDTAEPAQIIGPAFARQCGSEGDLFAFMAGSKMFFSTVNRVKAYLEATKAL